MLKLIRTSIVLCLAFLPAVSNQASVLRENRDIVVKYNTNHKMVLISRMYDLSGGSTDCQGPEEYTGKIVSVSHYDNDPTLILAFTISLKNGRRLFVMLDSNLYSHLSNADESWLYTLIARGKLVRVNLYMCGAGGNGLVADEIRAL